MWGLAEHRAEGKDAQGAIPPPNEGKVGVRNEVRDAGSIGGVVAASWTDLGGVATTVARGVARGGVPGRMARRVAPQAWGGPTVQLGGRAAVPSSHLGAEHRNKLNPQ